MEKIILILLIADAFFACAFSKHLRGKAYIIPALIGLGTAAYQLYQGSQQKKKAKNLKPSNYVPPSVQEAVSTSRIAATADSPGYTRGLERLKQSSASAISRAKQIGGSSAQVQQMVADTDAREKDQAKDLEVANAAFKNQSRGNLQNLLLAKGGYEQQSRDAFNAAKSALIGASEQNKYNAFTNALEGAVDLFPDSAFKGQVGKDKAAATAAVQTDTALQQQYMNSFQQQGNRRGLGRMRGTLNYPPFDPSLMYDPRLSTYKPQRLY